MIFPPQREEIRVANGDFVALAREIAGAAAGGPREGRVTTNSIISDPFEEESGRSLGGPRPAHVSRHNYFNILFVVIFFVSFEIFLVHFG